MIRAFNDRDPPFGVPIAGFASGLRNTKHEDFVMGSNLSKEELRTFLAGLLAQLVRWSTDGSIHYVRMDWRGINALLTVAEEFYTEIKNVCLWNKSNAGMGSLYRSKHELVAVFKNGTRPHTNNIELGRHGRNRTNVWDCPSQNSLSGSKKGKLSLHPTVKALAPVIDAIRDCSNRGDIILDACGGAGGALIAAEKTGRKGRLIELDPKYVEVTVERWERLTGKVATHADTGQPYGRRP